MKHKTKVLIDLFEISLRRKRDLLEFLDSLDKLCVKYANKRYPKELDEGEYDYYFKWETVE